MRFGGPPNWGARLEPRKGDKADPAGKWEATKACVGANDEAVQTGLRGTVFSIIIRIVPIMNESTA